MHSLSGRKKTVLVDQNQTLRKCLKIYDMESHEPTHTDTKIID